MDFSLTHTVCNDFNTKAKLGWKHLPSLVNTLHVWLVNREHDKMRRVHLGTRKDGDELDVLAAGIVLTNQTYFYTLGEG